MINATYRYFILDYIDIIKDGLQKEVESGEATPFDNGRRDAYIEILRYIEELGKKYSISLDKDTLMDFDDGLEYIKYRYLIRDLIYYMKDTLYKYKKGPIEGYGPIEGDEYQIGRVHTYHHLLNLLKGITIGFFLKLKDLDYFDYELEKGIPITEQDDLLIDDDE